MTEWIYVNAMLQSMTTVEDLIVGHMVFFLVVHELIQKMRGGPAIIVNMAPWSIFGEEPNRAVSKSIIIPRNVEHI